MVKFNIFYAESSEDDTGNWLKFNKCDTDTSKGDTS